MQTYDPSGTPNNATRFVLSVEVFTKMTIDKILGSVCIYPCKPVKLSGGGAPFFPDGSEIALGYAEQLTPTNGFYDLSNVDAVCFYISLGQYNSGASLDVDWQDRGTWAKCALEDIFLY